MPPRAVRSRPRAGDVRSRARASVGSRAMTTHDDGITERTVEARGLAFGILEAGSGALALRLHGFPDSAWTWRHLLPRLADAGFRAVAPFQRGYAPTAVPEDGCYQTAALGL